MPSKHLKKSRKSVNQKSKILLTISNLKNKKILIIY
jgi:hypothetical protein